MGCSDTFQNYRVHTLLDWILKIVLMGGVGLAIWAWFKNQALLDQILVVLLITLVITALLDIWTLVLLRKTQGIRAIVSLATQRLTLVAVIVLAAVVFLRPDNSEPPRPTQESISQWLRELG